MFSIVTIATEFMKYNKIQLEKKLEMIFSLGSGSAATEMSSEFPCLSLDNDRRVVHAGIINLKGNWIKRKAGIYHAYFDIRNAKGIVDIVNTIKNNYQL